MPAGAEANDLSGAQITAEFFIAAALRRRTQTGNTAAWDALSAPDCEFCADDRQRVHWSIGTNGAKFEGGELTILPDRTRTTLEV